uniref:Class III homeodomain-leucine zipper protein n=1 Tax=Ceratopteris pteridoides TaxID=58167 RepID=A0A2S1CVK0_9MONI|nr:class III homeodomain-leucine zipper protein [Ceratopteris pteridoides]
MGTAKAKDGKSGSADCGKYARYTPEQVDILERVYNDCPKPSSSRRQQLIKDCPILANIGHKQLKVWFQNRRCREKQRKEMTRLNSWNTKLNAMNQILMEENERLQKQAAHLTLENQYLRQQLQLQQPNLDLKRMNNPILANTTDTSSESVVTSGQHQHSPQHPSQEWSLSQLSAIAEKTLAEFLTKATGAVADGIPLPGMKPGPDSIGAFALTRSNGGVAAQACGIVGLEPFKVAEIAKNRPLWLRDCRRLDILASFAADRGGVVELIHTQMYAASVPSAADTAWDFWTLRYTCCMEDGSLVICERSLAAGQVLQDVPIMPGFVRAEMLSSGFLVRPCEQGGSMVLVIDDMNFKSGSFSETLRPLYESSTILARRMSCKVLCHFHNIVKEKVEMPPFGDAASSICGFSHKLIRGFNDAVNTFVDEGWVAIINNGPSAVSVHIQPSSCKQVGETRPRIHGGIVCAKVSFLLQGIPAALLLQLIRERWISWADLEGCSVPNDSAKLNGFDFPKKKFSSMRVFQPITAYDEVLEVIRVQKSRSESGEDILQSDDFLLQLCSGMEDIATGDHAQLIFASIDTSFPDDAPLLPSGFRVMNLGAAREKIPSSETLDLASSLEERSSDTKSPWRKSQLVQGQSSLVTIAFQHVYKAENRDIMVLNMQQHVQTLVEILQQAANSFCPHVPPVPLTNNNLEALVLVQQIADSYRSYLGQDLFPGIGRNPEAIFKSFWSLRDSIICCAWKPLPEFIFANHAALEMLETTAGSLRELSLEQMFNSNCKKTDYSQPPPFLQKDEYACLPSGICQSSTGRPVTFEHATGWKVVTNDLNAQIAAFMFCNWSFARVPM